MKNSGKVLVKNNLLLLDEISIEVGSQQWHEWLSEAKKFSFEDEHGCFLAQCEIRRNKPYWYAYRRRAGKLRKTYLGKSEELSLEHLRHVSASLAAPIFKQFKKQPGRNEAHKSEMRIDMHFLSSSKVNVPILPPQLVSRPRLVNRMNTPLTLIYAPSGFGKSILLSDWKKACGFPVAWLSLDEQDDHPVRFWLSVVKAFQIISPEFGQKLLPYLNSGNTLTPAEIVFYLMSDIQMAPFLRLGLVLDNFQHIHYTEIYDSIQLLLEHLSANMYLIISSQIKPPLLLGYLRARGLLTELDADDLRFTMKEGINYLQRSSPEPQLAYNDLEKLVRHTEGWAAGLTLTTLALSKNEDRRHFIDTFSGAHIYFREYFMETVLQNCTPETQSFLLKTSILKHLTGNLCDAVIGQNGSEEILENIWRENLFIVRLDDKGWYKYHDLLAEMLSSQLQVRFADEVPHLHQRAAQWYREQYAPAEAIYHLLSIGDWEEAATLIEEMALRELEQFGEDSRLLRWLQELPASVFQAHTDLLFVYLRLANIALPKQKIEQFINDIEINILNKPAASKTRHEIDVLSEIQHIRHVWAQGNVFMPPRAENKNGDKWDTLNRLHLIKQIYVLDSNLVEASIRDLLHQAQAQHNLFVVLMAGGVLCRRAILAGQLRRGERLSRQILEQALLQRGKLPEPASITLAALSQMHLERNDIELAKKYLAQIAAIDPNPTSTNMPVQSAILRSKIQMMQGETEDARATIRAIRELHRRQPSGLWSDQDLSAYEALICVQSGDIRSAEHLLEESQNSQRHHLSQLAQAEISLKRQKFELAEKLFSDIIGQYPNGVFLEPLISAQISYSLSLFGQNKNNRALQAMLDVVRLAVPERFIRPFLVSGADCIPLLSVALQADNLTREARKFIKEVLQLLTPDGTGQISKAEMERLSVSASISVREQEVLQLLNVGYSNREIASRLSISESTVKTHLGNIYEKLSVNNRLQAISQARKLDLVS